VDPIKLGIPSYPDIIKHPMDLGTCGRNLESNAVYRFVNLAAKICYAFPPPPPPTHMCASTRCVTDLCVLELNE